MGRAILLVAAHLLLACASSGKLSLVQSEYWAGERFEGYRRYAWLPTDAHRRAWTQAEDHRLHDLIRTAIDARMGARGFILSPPDQADFRVTYHCKITEKIQLEVIDRVWYGSGDTASWERVPRRLERSTFDEGSIVIDFTKPDGRQRVWRGVARGPISLDATPEQLEQIVDESVREILDEFPPPSRSTVSGKSAKRWSE